MKKYIAFISGLFVSSILFASIGSAMYAGVGISNKTVAGRNVQLVYINLDDKNVEVKTITAGKVGETASLADMAQREDAIAAINGGYFAAYSDMQPYGAIRSNGTYLHNGGDGALFGIDERNQAYFGRVRQTIEGATNGSWAWPHNWAAWGINHYYDDPNAITVLTPQAEKRALGSGRTIVVENDLVTAIVDGDADIPANGYLIHYGPNVVDAASVFHIGDTVSYKITNRDRDNNVLNWEHVFNMMGAGPLLVYEGQVVVNPQLEGFTDPKQTTNYQTVHSFIGQTYDNRLVLGTVPSVSVFELADVVKQLGMRHAVAMDSGASSGLYADDSYLTTPGRDVPSAVMVKIRSPLSAKSGFSDVSDNYWAANAIGNLFQKGIINGEQVDGTRVFRPESNLTRAEFATILAKTLNLQTTSNKKFTDTDGQWHERYVAAAYDAGYMSGYSVSEFGANDPITQEQIVKVMNKILVDHGVRETKKDPQWLAFQPSSWAVEDVRSAIRLGILGDSFGTALFAPQQDATRAEMASMLNVVIQKLGN